MIGGILSLLSSVFAADTVYLVLVSVSGFAVVAVWMSIAASQFLFRRRFLKEGHQLSDLKYRTPGYPAVPIAAFLLCSPPVSASLLIRTRPSPFIAELYLWPFATPLIT
ncbi:hypothetical protein [Bacillus velezensis]|uniref:hypothetical protein n=1 Tax=Bacillus velezensis TaxID=492670 RepID=UPI00399CFB2C